MAAFLERELVACKICGVARRRLTAHLRAEHGLTAQQYRARFPGVLVEVAASRKRSPECRAKQAAAAKKRWSSQEERDAQSKRLRENAPWKGKQLSEKHRARISAGGRGKTHELSAEEKQRRGEAGRRALKEVRSRPDHSIKLAKGVQKRIARGEQVGLMREEVRAKSLASRLRNGTLVPQHGGRGICGWRRDLPHFCRSTFEANFARILMLEQVPYQHEPRLFRLPSGRHYLPDFYLRRAWREFPEGWVELRGWRNSDGTLAGDRGDKIQEFEAMEDVSVFVLAQTDSLWRDLCSKFRSKIPLWERPRRNLRTHPEIFGVSKTG